uniref:Uncharacterized protein n=1 Tax=Timema cristinae TaxID=61476 RepID=A0A7R9DJU9_TIMCR|nr:unnamed protein product [Timema cristinae]
MHWDISLVTHCTLGLQKDRVIPEGFALKPTSYLEVRDMTVRERVVQIISARVCTLVRGIEPTTVRPIFNLEFKGLDVCLKLLRLRFYHAGSILYRSMVIVSGNIHLTNRNRVRQQISCVRNLRGGNVEKHPSSPRLRFEQGGVRWKRETIHFSGDSNPPSITSRGSIQFGCGAFGGVVIYPTGGAGTCYARRQRRSPLPFQAVLASPLDILTLVPLYVGRNAPSTVWANLDTLDCLLFEMEAGNGGTTNTTPPAMGPIQPDVATSPQRQGDGGRALVPQPVVTSSPLPLHQGDGVRAPAAVREMGPMELAIAGPSLALQPGISGPDHGVSADDHVGLVLSSTDSTLSPVNVSFRQEDQLDDRAVLDNAPSKPSLEKGNFMFVFYDFECRQETLLQGAAGTYLHEPNLCVV